MSLASNIRYLRRKQGISQDKLAELLGYKSYTTIQKWETGVSEPPLKKVHALAELFHVDIDLLAKGNMESADVSAPTTVPFGYAPIPPMTDVPLIGDIACGRPITAEENVVGRISVPNYWHADFVLTCHGDSMAPKIMDGDLVAIHAQQEVENGQIAAVRLEDEATLKRVYRYPDRLELRAINPDFESIFLFGEEINRASIDGRAIGLCRGL